MLSLSPTVSLSFDVVCMRVYVRAGLLADLAPRNLGWRCGILRKFQRKWRGEPKRQSGVGGCSPVKPGKCDSTVAEFPTCCPLLSEPPPSQPVSQPRALAVRRPEGGEGVPAAPCIIDGDGAVIGPSLGKVAFPLPAELIITITKNNRL